MISKVLENSKYQNIIKSQIKESIDFMLDEQLEFAITANIEGISFQPELPNAIHDKLSKFSLFVLSNYTYSTIIISNEFISFEAGFGSENFGSTVKIPLTAIFQIVIEESIIFINPIATLDNVISSFSSINKSKNVFKNNPKNKDLLH